MTDQVEPRGVRKAVIRYPALVVFACAFVLYAVTASWQHAWNSDVQASLLPAYQIAATGVPWLEGTTFADINPFFIEANGHIVSNRQIGIILWAVPFYWLAGAPLAVWPSALASVIAAAGAAALMFSALRTLVPRTSAFAATAVMVVGSPTWTVSADGLWSHTVTQLSIAAAAYFSSRNRWWFAGLALGLAILARPHMVAIALLLGLGVGWARRSFRIPLAVGIPAAGGLVLLVTLNRWIFGGWTLTGYSAYVSANFGGLGGLGGLGGDSGETSNPLSWASIQEYAVNWAGFLIAPDRGLFVWTPIALLLLPAAWRVRRQAPDWSLALLAGGLLYTAVQLRVNAFHGVDTFFGYRHALELFTCALPLYAMAWHYEARPVIRGIAAGLFVLQSTAMLMGAVHSQGWLGKDSVWIDNSFVYLIRESPAAMVPLVVAVGVVAIIVGVRVAQSAPASASSESASTR